MGVRLSIDYTDMSFGEESVTGAEINGLGWFAGPYVSAEIASNVFLDALAGYGTSSNDYRGSYEGFDLDGDFDTQRLLG